MVRRLLDLCLVVPAMVFVGPMLCIAAVGIRMSSQGPALYRALRIGRDGQLFTMFKLRTMHCRSVVGSSITSANDPRVFAVGRILRALKIDELPQLLNILKGEMSVVGPRPEAPDIVERHYTDEYRKSLAVPPGLTSPGSVFYYTHGEQLLADGEAEQFYVSRLLPLKMKLDLDYLPRMSVMGDLRIILQTGLVLAQKALGRTSFPTPDVLQVEDHENDEAQIISLEQHRARRAS
jgi:lipopolysaccharide/colanic/teichoic acid biosynthesis glycosyltransferase